MSKAPYTYPSIFNYLNQSQQGLGYVEPIEFVYTLCLINTFTLIIFFLIIYQEKKFSSLLFLLIKSLRKIAVNIITKCYNLSKINNQIINEIDDIKTDIITFKYKINNLECEINNLKGKKEN